MDKHQCVQFGVCPRADSGECFEVSADFKCGRNPEDLDCQSKLEEVSGGNGTKGLAFKVGIPAALLVVVGVTLFLVFGNDSNSQTTPSSAKPTVEELLQEVWPWLK